MLDGLDAKGRRDMGFTGARAANQDDVLGAGHELTTVELPHHGFVDLAGSEVEAGQVLVSWEARGLHVIGDGADLALGQLGLEQLGQDRHSCFKGWRALLAQVGDGLSHAIHLQAARAMMTMAALAGS